MNTATVLELTDLCDGLADARLDGTQRARLNTLLAESADARAFYVRFAGLSSSLCSYAAELQSEPRSEVAETRRLLPFPRGFWWGSGALAAAAAVVLAFVFGWSGKEAAEPESVAWLTGAQDAQWSDPTLAPGDALERGQRLELQRGLAEVTFDSGARVTLEAPVSLEVQSAWIAALRSGALTASASPDAAGFRVVSPGVDVTNLGGEVRVVAEHGGAAEVCALDGSAEAGQPGRREKLLLKNRQARRFAGDRVTRVNEAKFARRAPRLDRQARPLKFARFSFEETDGQAVAAQTLGFEPAAITANLETRQRRVGDRWLQPGRWRNALALDGQSFAAARIPGENPRTVAFWVNVPADAPLGEGVAMIGWNRKTRGLLRGAQITWNRDPERGPLGALRTEHEEHAVVGRNSLRDGQWHHVAVLFLGGKKTRGFVQVKQYVDGRLDGTGAIARRVRPGAGEKTEMVWIGRRANRSTLAEEGFRGGLDELFLADRPLAPDEIRRLMDENQPPGA